ncbi:MAG: tetratricopeptide repeat protein, partial [Chitinophagaceae bacterium]
MKQVLLTIFVLVFYGQAYSQQKPDSLTVVKLLDESKGYFTSDATKALNLATQALNQAKQLGLKKEEGYAYKNIGITYYFQGKYIEALENYNKSLEIFKSIKDYVGIANLQNNIGAVYYDRADYARALEFYLQSLKNSETAGDKLRILSALNNIGGVYSINPATKKKALEYYLRALELCKELGSTTEMGAISTNIGEIYFAENDDAQALYYFNQSLKAYGETEGSLNAYNALGRLYAREGKFEQAASFHNKALNLAMKLENDLSILQSLMGLANVHVKQGDFKKAIEYFKQAEIPASRAEENDDTKDLYREMSI